MLSYGFRSKSCRKCDPQGIASYLPLDLSNPWKKKDFKPELFTFDSSYRNELLWVPMLGDLKCLWFSLLTRQNDPIWVVYFRWGWNHQLDPWWLRMWEFVIQKDLQVFAVSIMFDIVCPHQTSEYKRGFEFWCMFVCADDLCSNWYKVLFLLFLLSTTLNIHCANIFML